VRSSLKGRLGGTGSSSSGFSREGEWRLGVRSSLKGRLVLLKSSDMEFATQSWMRGRCSRGERMGNAALPRPSKRSHFSLFLKDQVSVCERLSRWAVEPVLVALVWMEGLRVHSGMEFSIPWAGLLAIAVWLGYQADHLFDAYRDPVPRSDRHRWTTLHRNKLSFLWGVIFLGSLGVAVSRLEPGVFFRGMGLVVGILLYQVVIFLLPGGRGRSCFKRTMVALIFSLGIHFGAMGGASFGCTVLSMPVLFLLSLQNLIWISRWEQPRWEGFWSRLATALGGILLGAALGFVVAGHTLGLAVFWVQGITFALGRTTKLSLSVKRTLLDLGLATGALWLFV